MTDAKPDFSIMTHAEREAYRIKSQQSVFNSNSLASAFGPDHVKLVKMKNPSQCAMGLYDPLNVRWFSSSPVNTDHTEGSASWFVNMWESLLERDENKFRTYMGGSKVLDLHPPTDFCVHINKQATGPVVLFYIESRLQTLANSFFRNVTQSPAMTQALDILHSPSDEYREFLFTAGGRRQEFMQDGGTQASLDALRNLSM